MVEKINRMLQFLKHILVPLTLARGFGDSPERDGIAIAAVKRTGAQLIPAKSPLAGQGRRQTHLLGTAFALARGLCQTIHRLGHFRCAGKQPLDHADVGRLMRTGHVHIGVIGIKNLAIGGGHQNSVGGGIRHQFGQVIAGGLAGKLDQIDRQGKNTKYPREGQKRQNTDQKRGGHLIGQNRKQHRKANQHQRQNQHPRRTAGFIQTIHSS